MAEDCKIDGYTVTADDFPEELRDLVECIGISAMIGLMKCRGGQRIYIQKTDSLARKARNRQIKAAFDGRNYHALASANNITERYVRAIIDGPVE